MYKVNPTKILDIIVEKHKNILGKNLVGIYLHGSLAMGCYTNNSDIDFLVVVKEPLEFSMKKDIINSLIYLDNIPNKGLEMSIILEKYTKEFIHPTPFELHYSDFHRDRYLSDANYICGGFTDRDLAAHMTIIIHRGICLYGKEIKDTFGYVPKRDYIDSLIYDIENAKNDIIENPVYITLNLCRILYYLKENVICSKLEGGNWGKKSLPHQYRNTVLNAVKIYTEELDEIRYSEDTLIKYANYMLKEINYYIK